MTAPMASTRRARHRAAAAGVVALCATASILYGSAVTRHSSTMPRRLLSAERSDDRRPDTPAIYSWARKHVKPLARTPDPARETLLFWHIPKSGGTTVKSVYECFGRVLAGRVGADPAFGYGEDEELVAFRPWPWTSGATYVNVDAGSRPGIDRARRLGLVPSGIADLIVTGEPAYAVERLFDGSHKGRILAVFRHPVDRLVSKFYYLQTAKWERRYNPAWKRMTVEQWAEEENRDNNHVVKKLAGKGGHQAATEVDLRAAVRTVRQRFVVGLTEKMEESIRRFNVVMGVDGSHRRHGTCMGYFFKQGAERSENSNEHPKVEKGSSAWNILAEMNSLDIRLYNHVVQLFDEQKDVIDSYASSITAQDDFE